MPIQNISNVVQASQPTRLANDRLASDGVPAGVVTHTSVIADNQAIPAASVGLPEVATKPVDQSQLQNVVDSINRALKQADKNLEFSIDEDTKKAVVKLVDSETGDVIREFPSKEALAISRAIEQMQQGLLLKQKA